MRFELNVCAVYVDSQTLVAGGGCSSLSRNPTLFTLPIILSKNQSIEAFMMVDWSVTDALLGDPHQEFQWHEGGVRFD